MPGPIGTQTRSALRWLQKGRKTARGWLHRVSRCTAQREPLSAEVGVQIQEDDYDLSLLLYAFFTGTSTRNGAGGRGQAGRQAGRLETDHKT